MKDAALTEYVRALFGESQRFDLTRYLPAASRWVLDEAWLLFDDPNAALYYHPHETQCFILIDRSKRPDYYDRPHNKQSFALLDRPEKQEYRVWSTETMAGVLRVAETLPLVTHGALEVLLGELEVSSFPVEESTLVAEAVA